MEAVIKLKPLNNVMEPKLSRGLPVTMSRPTEARRKPTHAEAMVLAGEPPPSPVKVLKANVRTAKFSAGPNLRASLARGGAKKVKRMTERRAEKKPGTKAQASACHAFPCFAMG